MGEGSNLLDLLHRILAERQGAWNWDAVSAISAVLGVILNLVLVVSIWIAIRSLREAEKSRLVGLIIWTTERVQLIREDTYRLLGADLSEVANDAELLLECRRISAEYEQISYFVRTGLISEQHIFDMYGNLFVRVWNKLEPAILEIRRQDGESLGIKDGVLSRSNFETLVNAFRPRISSNASASIRAANPRTTALNEGTDQ